MNEIVSDNRGSLRWLHQDDILMSFEVIYDPDTDYLGAWEYTIAVKMWYIDPNTGKEIYWDHPWQSDMMYSFRKNVTVV